MTRSTLRAVISVIALGVVSTACASSGSSSTSTPANPAVAASSQCSPGTGLTQTATTHSYDMVLNVGPSEAMYTPAQVAAQHLTTGEVMLRGQMTETAGPGTAGSSATTMMGATATMPMSQTTGAGMAGSNAAPTARHLEVQICSRSTGQVVQDAQPTITVTDHTAGGMTDHVPVAVMQGVGRGADDLHYGNNVTMAAGHPYTVTVSLNGDTAAFNLTSPN